MDVLESTTQEMDECDLSIPRGGPIYIPNMMGPLTSVLEFENNVILELQNLQAQLSQDVSEVCDDDMSVDKLKVFTAEELMDMALKEVLKNRKNDENNPPRTQQFIEGTEDDHRMLVMGHAFSDTHGTGADASDSFEQLNGSSAGSSCNKNATRKSSSRRKKGGRSFILESGCMEKLEQVVKIKQKQEEDKAAVRLHSFNPACINESAVRSARTERMKSLRSTNAAKKVSTPGLQEQIPVLYPEIVLYVEVYHNVRKGVKTQELLVLGGQSLTALRDKIHCSMDQEMQKAGQHDPSGYFLIEDVFHSDLRNPSAVDYSKPISDWLQNSKEEVHKKWQCITTGELQKKHKAIMDRTPPSPLPQFGFFSMENICFRDIKFQLGAGYLYCHQGECSHTFVIRDMRLIHPNDVNNRAAYPITTFQLKLLFKKCSVCKIFRATKVTVDDKWTPENPSYFCDECFPLLHQAEDGSFLYMDFLEYDYHHD